MIIYRNCAMNEFLKKKFYLLLTVLITLLLTYCSKEKSPDVVTEWKYLEDTIHLTDVSASLIRLAAELEGITEFNPYFRENISIHKITYHTTYKDSDIIVSGLISYPTSTTEPLPILLVQNGLFYESRRAPSNFAFPNNYLGYEFLSAYNYIVFLPDLIGFGESENLVHPLYHVGYSTSVVQDMIKAGNEFVKEKELLTTGDYFFVGYSLGAYISAATQKIIEETHEPEINIIANAIGAGGFNIKYLLDDMIDESTYPSPVDLVMVLYAYNITYDWNIPLENLFDKKYSTAIPKLYNGDFSRLEINSLLSTEIDSLLNPQLLESFRNGTENRFTPAFIENSIDDWAPLAPLRIYHSRTDERIPFSDSEKAYEKMRENGSTSVQFIEVTGEGHFDAIFDFVGRLLPWFDSLRYEIK